MEHPRALIEADQTAGLKAIRAFLRVRTAYDVLPLSFRLIVLDTQLTVKKSLNILTQSNIVSAPLWNSATSTFAGLLTAQDFINVIQYYYQHPHSRHEIDQFKLTGLRDVEKAIGAFPPETIFIHPLKPLYEACMMMIQSRARRIPLIDKDDETSEEMLVSVLTQYRILKFVAVNCKETHKLRKPLRELNIGEYTNLALGTMDLPVIEVIKLMVDRGIASVPIVDADGILLNVYEAVDVIHLIKAGAYQDLDLTVGEAILKRSDDFPGVHKCTTEDKLDSIFDTIRKSRIHRLLVVDGSDKLKGIITLSDILSYILVDEEVPRRSRTTSDV